MDNKELKNTIDGNKNYTSTIRQLLEQIEKRDQFIELYLSDKSELSIQLERLKNQLSLLADHEKILQYKIDSLDKQLREVKNEASSLSTEITTIYNTTAWKLVEILWKIRFTILPKNSRRENWLKSIYRLAQRIWNIDKNTKTLIVDEKQEEEVLISRDRQQEQYNDLFYKDWIENNEPGVEELISLVTLGNNFTYKPLISIVMPVYNPPLEAFREAVQSVLEQTYNNWELCILNACVSNLEVRGIINTFCAQDNRILVKEVKSNLGIAGNTNVGISLAQGEFIAFLDHDDCLAPFALYEIVKALQSFNCADLIYSDEDKISDDGQHRYSAFFKPDFSPNMIRSWNYISHFLVIRKSIGDHIGWIREGFEGSQDHDLILRVIEQTNNILHISKILYHWRAVPGSAASSSDSKPYAIQSGIKAVTEHIKRLGMDGKVEKGLFNFSYKVTYQTINQKVSIIIPNQDHEDDLKSCVESIIYKTSYDNYEIIIVENGSSNASTFDLYNKFKQNSKIKVIEWKNPFNYSLVNNFAVQHTTGDIILLLNNDVTVINSDWLERMVEYAQHENIGAVGAKLYYPDDTIQHAGVIVGIGGVAGHTHRSFPRSSYGYFGRLQVVQNLSAVTGACLMVRKNIFEEIHGFDEGYPLAFGDIDFCLRIREKGYLIVWSPFAELYHFESKTRGYEDSPEKLERFEHEMDRFKKRWNKFLENGDIYYNKNLSLERDDFAIDPDRKSGNKKFKAKINHQK